MRDALAHHDAILRDAVERHDSCAVKTTGDGMHAAFPSDPDAVAAAVDGQRALHDAQWPGLDAFRVRMNLHSGRTEVRDGDYFGTPVNRAARIMAVAHGGQIVASAATHELARHLRHQSTFSEAAGDAPFDAVEEL